MAATTERNTDGRIVYLIRVLSAKISYDDDDDDSVFLFGLLMLYHIIHL
jgi:hypothetical protein